MFAADVLLGHEHDFRVKHLSEALNDKHGPLAGEYCSPARGQPPLHSRPSPEGLLRPGLAGLSAPRMSLAYSPLSLSCLSLFWALGPLASLQVGVHAWLSGPGPRAEVAATRKAGREGRRAPGGQGASTRDSSDGSKALTPRSLSLGT